jgi:predicted nuclease of predicted toxin-antitoxin system
LQPKPSVILLRIGNATNRSLMLWLRERWPGVQSLLERGETFIEVR